MRAVPLGVVLVAAGCWNAAPEASPAAADAPPRVSPRHGMIVRYFIGKIDGGGGGSWQTWVNPDLPPTAMTTSRGKCGPDGGPTGEVEWLLIAHRGDADVYRLTLRYPLEGPDTRTETAEVEFRGARVKVFEGDAYGVVLEPAPLWRP
jgi:hypothetical protein